jgi:DNA-directed RNA polymerase specialized sigma24 family protein
VEGSGLALEADEIELAAAALPTAQTLVALARRRLDDELRALPPLTTSAGRRALLADLAHGGCSFGVLAHALRAAARAGQMAEARELFMALLRRTDGLNRRWVAMALWKARVSAAERSDYAQDLAQELTLYLWEQLARRDDVAWELFYSRSLEYAQGHVATIYLRRQGLLTDPRARRPERGLAPVFSRLTSDDGEDGAAAELPLAAMPAFSQAELADLRALVTRLPARERLAVVLRFWQQASETEIAVALGGVTTRAVRYTLRRAYARLRAWYAGEDAADDQADSQEEAPDDRS